MTLHPRLTMVGMLATLVTLALVVPAQATVINHEHYSGTESVHDVACGVEVRIDREWSGVFHLRVGTGKNASAFFGHDNYESKATYTNEANGNFVDIEHDGVVNDTTGTRVSGSVFRFTTISAGQPIRIRDMTGRVVSRDRGVIRETYLFDTLGDDTPGGIFLDSLDVRVAGPHPLFPLVFDEAAFCAIVQPLLLA
jgi:hypothetical protein